MTHPSTLTLHRLRCGELGEVELAAVRGHLASCERCASRLRAQEAERAAFVLRPIPDAIRELASPPPARRWWHDLVPFALAAAAATLLFVAVPELREATSVAPDGIRYRGELPDVEVWVDAGAGVHALRPGERLRPGDKVQLQYDPRGASVVAIAGRDATGEVQVFTTQAPTGIGLVRAPFALTLDGAPGAQELFVVGADRALTEAEVKAAVTHGVPGVRVARVTLDKDR